MTLEDRLTQYVANLKWEDIPSPARDAVSKMLIDTVGVILAGLKSKECQNLLDFLIEAIEIIGIDSDIFGT